MRGAIAALLLSAACASAPNLVDSHVKTIEPGDPIEITLENFDTQITPMRGAKQTLTFDVVVANNSDLDVTVANITIYQSALAPLTLEPYALAPNVVIEPGKEHKFSASIAASHVPERSAASVSVPNVALRVVVTLSNGDGYVTAFEVPIVER